MDDAQAHKDIPSQLLSTSKPLTASIVIASFGKPTPYNKPAFDLSIEIDPNSPPPTQEKPLRYGKLPEIHHTFRSDPKSPPKIITLVFTAAVVVTLPVLLTMVCNKLFDQSLSFANWYYSVGFLGCKSQSSVKSPWKLSDSTYSLLLLDPRHGICIFYVLYLMEFVPDAASRVGNRPRGFSKWQQSAA